MQCLSFDDCVSFYLQSFVIKNYSHTFVYNMNMCRQIDLDSDGI